ncbi:hypothetical protein DB347_08640 [Opitutaceae bacterium EW11]|nr:hypothetical protein DB347_08640 [Opitutaceae bacterium EW11]
MSPPTAPDISRNTPSPPKASPSAVDPSDTSRRDATTTMQELAAILQESPVVAIRWRLEPGWPVEYVSENIRLFGYTAEDFASGAVSLSDLLVDERNAMTDQCPESELVSGYRRLEYRMRTAGTARPLVRFLVRTARDERGRLCCQGLMTEVPESLAHEERLRLLEQAINTAHSGIIIADARLSDLPVIFANSAVETISGYAPEEFLGRNCRFLQGNDVEQPGLEIVRRALAEKRDCEAVLRNYRKDGTPFWNEIRLSPVRNRSGEVTHFIGVQADITARKEAEAAMARRDAILEAVSVATETLLRSDNYHQALSTALRQIGEVTGADHLCVWQEKKSGDHRTLSLDQAWFGPSLPYPPFDRYQGIAWEESLGWPSAEELRQGRVVQGGVEGRAQPEKELLRSLGTQSYLCLPILEGPNRFWGLLTLGCREAGVKWNPVEVEALRSATRVLGAIIHNQRTERELRLGEQRYRELSGDYELTNQALRKSEAQYRSLVTNLKEVVFQTDAQGLWTYLNSAWTEITGFSVEESLGKSFLGFVHPDDRQRNSELFLPLIERKKEYCRHEVRYLAKGEPYRWIEVFARLTTDENGVMTGTAGTLSDITARREAEDVLRRQLLAIEAAADGIAILDREGVYTYVNSTHAVLFGYANAYELVGKSWRELYGPEEQALLEQQILPTLREKRQWRGTLQARRRDGSFFDQELSLTLEEDGGIVSVCRDVSERRRAEERLQKSLKEKDVMLKEIHHRVKNNMQIVSSLLNLQLEHVKDEHMRALFVDSQSRIVSMALVHEKLYQSADLARIDFGEYARDLTDSLVGSQDARSARISFQLDCDDLHLGVDTAIPCGLIINELVSNAYKHAFPSGGAGAIRLRLARTSPGWLELEVADNGAGMPVDIDVSRAGTLGLQLVATLVQQLRGTIEVYRDAGTRFVLRLHEAPEKRLVQ